jgi:hypothetical protein
LGEPGRWVARWHRPCAEGGAGEPRGRRQLRATGARHRTALHGRRCGVGPTQEGHRVWGRAPHQVLCPHARPHPCHAGRARWARSTPAPAPRAAARPRSRRAGRPAPAQLRRTRRAARPRGRGGGRLGAAAPRPGFPAPTASASVRGQRGDFTLGGTNAKPAFTSAPRFRSAGVAGSGGLPRLLVWAWGWRATRSPEPGAAAGLRAGGCVGQSARGRLLLPPYPRQSPTPPHPRQHPPPARPRRDKMGTSV